jgi:hypothetical protein
MKKYYNKNLHKKKDEFIYFTERLRADFVWPSIPNAH